MPEILISIHHENLNEVEGLLSRFREMDASFEWYDLRISNEKECICGGFIEGNYDVDGWNYHCLNCGKWYENNNGELQLVPE